VGFQRHALADLLSGNSLGTQSTGGWMGPQGPSGWMRRQENFGPERVPNPETSSA